MRKSITQKAVRNPSRTLAEFTMVATNGKTAGKIPRINRMIRKMKARINTMKTIATDEETRMMEDRGKKVDAPKEMNGNPPESAASITVLIGIEVKAATPTVITKYIV